MSKEVVLNTIGGRCLYAASVEKMLEEFNSSVHQYEIRVAEDGKQQLWHKGHQRMVGEFREVERS